MGSAPSAPAPPDPVATANAQGTMNKDTAYWNAVMGNVNQTTPYGSINYTHTAPTNAAYDTALANYNTQKGVAAPVRTAYANNKDYHTAMQTYRQGQRAKAPDKADYADSETPPQFSSQITLSPAQQHLLESQQHNDQSLQDLGTAQMGRISDAVSTPYSYNGLPQAPQSSDINALSQAGTDAIMSRMEPQFARDEEALRSRLINQGIGQGSAAYNTEMERFNQSKTDARQQAILQGQAYGGAEQNQMLGLRNQGIQEYNAQRNAPLNEYSALTSGQQIQNPSFQAPNPGNAQAGDYQGAVQNAYNAKMAQYNAGVGSSNNTMSGLFGLGGAAANGFLGSTAGSAWLAGLSDRDVKENIIHVGEENGHKIYEFNYKGIPDRKFTGVMAQDVEQINPEAVTERNGFKYVNYDMINVEMRAV